LLFITTAAGSDSINDFVTLIGGKLIVCAKFEEPLIAVRLSCIVTGTVPV